MIQRILTVARRELGSYFDHATAYILLVIFLAINFFFFFRDAYLMGEASLRPMFGLLPWLLLFFVPAVCMRALAEEQRSGTMEVVLSQPLTALEFLLGKFLGVFAFLAIAMAGTLGAAVGLSFGADLQWGIIVAQYVGSLFLIATLVAVGLWTSSMTQNQVTAFILGVAVTFALYAIGLEVVVLGLPGPLAQIAARLGVLRHFGAVARGVIDLRDVLYFASVAAAFLALTYYSLLRWRLSRKRTAYRRLSIGTAGLVGVAVMVSLLGSQIRGRLDLTPGGIYTLSDPTKRILQGLDDLVTVKLFASRELPPEFVPTLRDLEDLLRDYSAAGSDNFRLQELSPEGDDEAREEATSLGIPEITFNVYGEEELQVKQGYLGLAIQYAGETEIIPVVQQTRDLEYRLTSAIVSLTREEMPAVGFARGHGEYDLFQDLQGVASQLRAEYGVQAVGFSEDEAAALDTLDVLAVVNPRQPWPPEHGDRLEAFLDRGGSLLVLVSGVQVDQRSGFAAPAEHPVLDSLLTKLGAGLGSGMAYDLQSRATVQMRGSSGMVFGVPYPLWPKLVASSEHIVVKDLGPIMAPWSTPLEILAEDTSSVTPLLRTTEYGGQMSLPASIDATQDWAPLASGLGIQIVGAAILPERGAEGDAGGEATEGSGGGSHGRVIVVGSGEVVLDDYLRSDPTALRFFLNAVDWLAQDESLIAIRSKNRSPPQLLFPSALVRDAVKYGNLLGVPLLFVLFGMLRVARRRAYGKRARAAEQTEETREADAAGDPGAASDPLEAEAAAEAKEGPEEGEEEESGPNDDPERRHPE